MSDEIKHPNHKHNFRVVGYGVLENLQSDLKVTYDILNCAICDETSKQFKNAKDADEYFFWTGTY